MLNAPTMPPPRLAGDRGRLREQRDSQHNHHRAPILIAHLRRREAPIPSKSSQPAQRRHVSNTIHALAGNSVQSRVKKTRLNRRLPGACGGTSSTSAQIPRVIRFRTSSLAPANTPPGLSRAGPLVPSPWGATCKTSGPAGDTLHPVPRSPRRNTTRIPLQSETHADRGGQAAIRQLLDIDTGIPTTNNTHEVAQDVQPGCRVVYADNDPRPKPPDMPLRPGEPRCSARQPERRLFVRRSVGY
jgi:hypothetical protein